MRYMRNMHRPSKSLRTQRRNRPVAPEKTLICFKYCIQKQKKIIAERMKARGMHDDELAELLDITPRRLKEILSAECVHEDNIMP